MQKKLIKNSSMQHIWGLSHALKYLCATDMEVLVGRISLHKLDYGQCRINQSWHSVTMILRKNTEIQWVSVDFFNCRCMI